MRHARTGRHRSLDAMRTLVLVLGDQLDPASSALDGFDAEQDAIWMAEVAGESTHVWSSKPRTALFLSAMRHFAAAQRTIGRTVHYVALDEAANTGTLAGELQRMVAARRPERLVMTEPGDWRVREALAAVARDAALPLEIRVDRHFLSTVEEFAAHAKGRKQLRLEFWYRELPGSTASFSTATAGRKAAIGTTTPRTVAASAGKGRGCSRLRHRSRPIRRRARSSRSSTDAFLTIPADSTSSIGP